jgi:hypothetical protein
MLHTKKALSVILFLGIALTGLQAQIMYVKEKGGTQTSLALNDIRKISFAEGNLAVNRANGISGIYALSNIRYLSFTDYATSFSEQRLQQSLGMFLYPNPTEDILQIKYESVIPGFMQIRIIDVQGRLVKQIEQNCQSGINNAYIDVSGLQGGFYIFRMHIGKKTETGRFVKK